MSIYLQNIKSHCLAQGTTLSGNQYVPNPYFKAGSTMHRDVCRPLFIAPILRMTIVFFIMLEMTTPLMILPRMLTLLVNGSLWSMYAPVMASWGVLNPKPTVFQYLTFFDVETFKAFCYLRSIFPSSEILYHPLP